MKDLTRFFKLFFYVVLIFSFVSLTAYAGVPHVINYQGSLTDSNELLLEGMHNVTFKIYDAESGGDLKWEETQSVTFHNGVFNILLGSSETLNISFDKACWLAIKVGNESERSERVQIFSVESISGIITMWSGSAAQVPEGWALCNGLNSTPDLTSRFIVGAGSFYSAGESGGNGSHNHTATSGYATQHRAVDDHSGGGNDGNYSGCRRDAYDPHTHDITLYTSSNLPPYYALAYIMKK